MINFYISMVLMLWALVSVAFYAMLFFSAILALSEYARERWALLKKMPAFPFSLPSGRFVKPTCALRPFP